MKPTFISVLTDDDRFREVAADGETSVHFVTNKQIPYMATEMPIDLEDLGDEMPPVSGDEHIFINNRYAGTDRVPIVKRQLTKLFDLEDLSDIKATAFILQTLGIKIVQDLKDILNNIDFFESNVAFIKHLDSYKKSDTLSPENELVVIQHVLLVHELGSLMDILLQEDKLPAALSGLYLEVEKLTSLLDGVKSTEATIEEARRMIKEVVEISISTDYEEQHGIEKLVE
ncbi:hypothetical protein ACFL3T_01400 [Patescibacteria group bacterium]